jgi:HAD superfamily hydrolase (TIGR01509 family)
LRAAMRAMYAVTQSNWHPEEDAIPTLRTLREGGFHTGLVSNAADDENTQVLIDKGGFRPYLEYVLSSAAFGRRKPHPGIFRAALDHFQVAAARAVMIGDSYEADVSGGHGAGLNTIWITRRARELPPTEPVAADAIVSTLREIPELVSN